METLDSRRIDSGLFRSLVDRLPWYAVLKDKRVQEGWTVFRKEFLEAQEQAVPICQKMSCRGRRLRCLNRELQLELRRKKRVYDLRKKAQATKEDYRDIVRLCREKISRVKAQLEVSLSTALKDDKTISINMLTTERGLRTNSILYWMWGETQQQRLRRRLMYSVLSLSHSLTVRLVVLRVPSTLSWKTGKGRRMKPP